MLVGNNKVRPRSYAVQHRETDLDFVERLLTEEGLGYTFVEDAQAPAGHTLVIFGDSRQLPEDATSAAGVSGIRFHRAADLVLANDEESIHVRRSHLRFLAWG